MRTGWNPLALPEEHHIPLRKAMATHRIGFTIWLLLLFGCGKEPATHIPDGLIKQAIEHAQRDGRTTVEIRIPFDPPEDLSLGLNEALQRSSVVVVKPTGRSIVSVGSSVLFTWYVVKVEDAI